MQRVAVELGVDGDGADAELAARPDDADRDLAPIGDEHLVEHSYPPPPARAPVAGHPMVSPVSPSGFELHSRSSATDSTNDWALAAAPRRARRTGSVVVADFQRRGRGRLDRRWEAPAGSALLCSVLLRADAPRGGAAPAARSRSASPRAEGCDAVARRRHRPQVAERPRRRGPKARRHPRGDRRPGGARRRRRPSWSASASTSRGLVRRTPNGTSLATASSDRTVTPRRAPRGLPRRARPCGTASLRTEDGRAALVAARTAAASSRSDGRVGCSCTTCRRRRLRRGRRRAGPPRASRPSRASAALATGDVVHLR